MANLSKEPSLQIQSRMKFDKYSNINGIELWEHMDYPELEEAPEGFYSVKGTHMLRHDLVSNEVYDDTVLWWALALKNGYRYIFDDMKPGHILQIPTMSEISGEARIKLKEKKR